MGEITFKSIKELSGNFFRIPSYQRGYRWTESEVSALLDDLYEYAVSLRNSRNETKFYCLQPLVVKELHDEYEVIDGQQRLTTIFLILKYLEPYAKNALEMTDYELFSLNYESRGRESCKKFFDEERYKSESSENLDFLYLSKAYKTISDWFGTGSTASVSKKCDVFNVLFLRDDHNAQFIWYSIPNEENAYTVFKRLNSGKLSLTNSELVKALILNDEDKDDDFNQEDIAREWEAIENHLSDDNLWYFINASPEDKKYESTRIDFVLELLLLSKKIELKDNYFIFSKISDLIKSAGWKNIWEEIKSTYRTLQSWYDDRKLYHYIGFLMNSKGSNKVSGPELLKIYAENDNKSFFAEVQKHCRKIIIGNKDFSELSYGKDNDAIHNILLAFNLATTQNQISETTRYPFKNHFEATKNQWSLEHIHAQNERQANWSEQEISQLKADLKRIASTNDENEQKNIEEFSDYLNQDTLKDEETYHALLAVFMGEKLELTKNEDGQIESVSSNFEKDDSLMNLALLQLDKNAAFNNKTYPEKRRVLAKYENAEKETAFIPICTRNAFFKHYSPDARNSLIWDKQAGIDYVKAMLSVVGNFISAKPFDNFGEKNPDTFKYGLKSLDN